MAKVISSIDNVFDSPEFSTTYSEWQYARMTALERTDQLAAQIAERYKDWELGQYSADVEVDYALAMPPEEFKEAFSDHDKALRLAALRDSANIAEDEAKEAVLQTGKEQDLGQFAMYGLWLHMRESGVVPKTELRHKVTQVEMDFENFDKFIQANNGQLLTLMNLGAYAGRIGNGGIQITDNHRVVIPVEGTTYAMSYMEELDEVYEDRIIPVGTSDIHSIFGSKKTKLLGSWSPLLRVETAYDVGGVTLAVGEVVEGPPYITQERDRDFYQMIFERTRAVSRLALLSS